MKRMLEPGDENAFAMVECKHSTSISMKREPAHKPE